MKKRLISLILSLVTVLGVALLGLTGCAQDTPQEENKNVNVATTLVLWCVSEQGTDDAQAQAVAKAMSDMTQSQFKTKLLVKYFTMDEYYEQLEKALAQLQSDRAADKTKPANPTTTNTETAEVTTKNSDGLVIDEEGNPVIDTTVYPEVKDHQVDILYLSGYDKYTQYIAKGWLSSLNSELNGSSKAISSYVPSALLGAVKYNGTTYAIPNNNVIGEYTYMLIDRELYDKYYYTASVQDVHGVEDLAPFLEDIVAYETDVLPINGDVNYCMSLIAHYWDVDPETAKVTGDFSVVGYSYKDTDKINRGDVALKFDSLLTNSTYRTALANLMDFQFKGYFGTAAEGQRSAVTFAKGDAASATQYEEDYYVVVVDYPRASNEDLYQNMFAVSTYTTSLAKSMQVVTWLNTNSEFRNLFQYGIENVNYELESDGTVTMMRSNAYNMDLSKTGNEFIAYVPSGTNVKVWEYAKQQNREAMIDPLLGFDFAFELIDESEKAASDEDQQDEYVIETLDKELLTYLSELSDKVWAEIQGCGNDVEAIKALGSDEQALRAYLNGSIEKIRALETPDEEQLAFVAALEELLAAEQLDAQEVKQAYMDRLDPVLDKYAVSLSLASDEYIKRAGVYTMVEPEFDKEGKPALDKNGEPVVADPTVDVNCEVRTRTVVKNGKEKTETYFVLTKNLTPFQVYYRWMNAYGYCPKNFS